MMDRTRRRVGRPLAKKFFLFTATLVFWVVAVMLAYDLRVDTIDASRVALLCVVVVLVSGAIAQFTSRALARPLSLLRDGIMAVQRGELTPIQVSPTRDEVQFLGESFNQIIEMLAASQKDILQRTSELETANRQAREASRARDRLLAHLSDELGRPLHEIVSLVHGLEGELANEDASEELQTARHSAQSTLALLNQLLEDASGPALNPATSNGRNSATLPAANS